MTMNRNPSQTGGNPSQKRTGNPSQQKGRTNPSQPTQTGKSHPRRNESRRSTDSDSEDDTESKPLTLAIPWNTTTKLLTGVAVTVALFHAAPCWSEGFYGSIASRASTLCSRIPAPAHDWASKAGTSFTSSLPSVSTARTWSLGLLSGMVAGAALLGTCKGMEISVGIKERRDEDSGSTESGSVHQKQPQLLGTRPAVPVITLTPSARVNGPSV